MAMWAAGIAGAAAVVAWWQIVGPGYIWLTGPTVGIIALGGHLLSPHPLLVVAAIGGFGAVLVARRPVPATILLSAAAVAAVVVAAGAGSWPLAVTGSLALGGVTGEMLLGHWYLVAPQMPRWALRRLDGAGAAGLVLDAALLGLGGFLAGTAGVTPWIFAALALVSIVLMVATWFALAEKGYEGVMAATGLSYLAVLTSLGAVAVGRALLGGEGSFLPLS